MVKSFKNTPGVSQKFSCNISSSTFWFENSRDIKTTVSFLNYWKLKNNLEVKINANIYSMSGKLIEKKNINFTKGLVKNFTPLDGKHGAGSVEIKIISSQNLRIPYAAIVAIYKTKQGITGVHSYSRVYYEKGESMSEGIEGSWTIRDNEKISSFCVFHNGNKIQEPQNMKVCVQNKNDKTLVCNIKLPKLRPFSTVKIKLKDYFSNLKEFLDGEIGAAYTEYKVKGGFARMLIGNESAIKGEDMQVTHSNFCYKKTGSDYLEKNVKSLKVYPGKVNKNSRFIIYPHLVDGNYEAILGTKKLNITKNQKVLDLTPSAEYKEINFKAKSGKLPSRLQLGLVTQYNKKRIPNEVAFSSITSIEPLKRFHWGVCAIGKNYSTKIIILDFKNLDKTVSKIKEITISLYKANSKIVEKKVFFKKTDLKKFSEGVSISNIFKNLKISNKLSFCYYSVFSEYGRFLCYSEISNRYGSVFKEHSF